MVAERSGFPVAWTRLTLDGRPIHSLVETGTSLGATEYVLKYRNGGIRFGRPDGRAAVAGHIMASLAGPASAELLLRGYVSDEDLRRITAVSATGDVARARALTEFLCRIEQALPREDAIVDDRQLSLTIDMAPTCAAHVEAAYGNLTRRMRATAEAAFPAIKAVAHALLANSHRLEGEAVRAIIARTVP